MNGMRTFMVYVLIFGILAGAVCLWWTTQSRLTIVEKSVVGQVQKYNEQRKALLEEVDNKK